MSNSGAIVNAPNSPTDPYRYRCQLCVLKTQKFQRITHFQLAHTSQIFLFKDTHTQTAQTQRGIQSLQQATCEDGTEFTVHVSRCSQLTRWTSDQNASVCRADRLSCDWSEPSVSLSPGEAWPAHVWSSEDARH